MSLPDPYLPYVSCSPLSVTSPDPAGVVLLTSPAGLLLPSVSPPLLLSVFNPSSVPPDFSLHVAVPTSVPLPVLLPPFVPLFFIHHRRVIFIHHRLMFSLTATATITALFEQFLLPTGL